MNTWLKRMAIFATLIMFLVMIAGSLVTKTGSAMGCGNDWPLCNGKWVPEYTIQSIIEYTHRMVTGFAGIVVTVFAVWSWLRYRGNREVLATAGFAFFFIVVESGLGAAAVISPQSPPVLALHFGFSLLAYSGVFLLTAYIVQKDKSKLVIQEPVSNGFRRFVWAVTIYAYGVVYLGAFVRHNGASMGCGKEFPLCNGSVVPQLDGLAAIHFMHRTAGIVLALLIVGLMIYAVRHYRTSRRDIYVSSVIALVLVVMQILAGVAVIFTELHLYATITHSAIITILFGILCYMCVQTLRKPEQ